MALKANRGGGGQSRRLKGKQTPTRTQARKGGKSPAVKRAKRRR